MAVAYLEQLLKDAIGLDVASVGLSAVSRAAQARQRACGAASLEVYASLVRNSEAELQNLIEEVVVPETWFFRDRQAFEALQSVVRAMRTRLDAPPLRLLSLPCSTGEEPYSISMALFDAGLGPKGFAIDAVDVSEDALKVARTAVYGPESFREPGVDVRNRFFDRDPHGFRVLPIVKDPVSFEHGNLVSPELLPGVAVYDVIFCRNLLIYFDGPTQKRAVAALARLLRPDGYLFVGSSESGVLWHEGFSPSRFPRAFAVRKDEAAATRGESALPRPLSLPSPRRPIFPPPQPAGRPSPGVPPAALPGLDEARRLGDAGRFADAAHICEAHLKIQASAEAYYLLALVADATGRVADAAAHYRRALYLDPGHAEALAQFAALLEQQGERSLAQALRNRGRRVATNQKASGE